MTQHEVYAKAVATLAIWAATALILVFGVFSMNICGDLALLILCQMVIVICGMAVVSTAAVWGNLPRATVSGSPKENAMSAAIAPVRSAGPQSDGIKRAWNRPR